MRFGGTIDSMCFGQGGCLFRGLHPTNSWSSSSKIHAVIMLKGKQMANGCHTHQTILFINNFTVQCNFYKGRASFRLYRMHDFGIIPEERMVRLWS